MTTITASRFLFGLWAEGDDGSRLATDVYLPEPSGSQAPAGSRPTILMRTPYGKRTPAMMQLGRLLSQLGFAVVLQDVAGRYGSEGRFEPFLQEPADSTTTLAWLKQQPWFSPQHGLLLFGVSYSVYTAFAMLEAAAAEDIPVVGVVAMAGMADPHAHFYQGGCFQLHWALPWSYLVGGRRDELPEPAALQTLAAAMPRNTSDNPLLERWSGTPDPEDTYWSAANLFPMLARYPVPGLHLCGTFDFTLDVGLSLFEAMEQAAPGRQRLVVGPWDHNQIFAAFLKQLGHHAKQDGGPTFLADLFLATCFGHNGADTKTDARIYLSPRSEVPSNDDDFISHDAPAGRRKVTLPLRGEKTVTWHHDPARPLPWSVGNCWTMPGWSDAGPVRQNSAPQDPREAFVCTQPLNAPLTVRGPVFLALQPWVEPASPEPFDLCVRLWCVQPDGTRLWVRDGVLHMPAGTGAEKQRGAWVAPALGWTAFQFPAGSRLGVSLSGSLFPKFAVTGEAGRISHAADDATPMRLTLTLCDTQPETLEFLP